MFRKKDLYKKIFVVKVYDRDEDLIDEWDFDNHVTVDTDRDGWLCFYNQKFSMGFNKNRIFRYTVTEIKYKPNFI